MFSFLKYVIFAIGLLTVYVLIEHFVVNRGEVGQSLSESINQAGEAVVSKVQEVSDNINDEYIQPTIKEVETSE